MKVIIKILILGLLSSNLFAASKVIAEKFSVATCIEDMPKEEIKKPAQKFCLDNQFGEEVEVQEIIELSAFVTGWGFPRSPIPCSLIVVKTFEVNFVCY